MRRLHEQEEKGFSALDRIDVDPDRLYPAITDEQRASIRKRLEDTMEAASEAAADEIGRDVAIEINSLAVQSYVESRTNVMIVHVSETDRAMLRQRIGEAVAEGKQWREIEAIVHEFFDGRRDNSMTIARTETAGPYNRAQFETWKAGGVTRKFWLTMQDEAVRDSHVLAGQRYSEDHSIGMDERFEVGRDSMLVPGEGSLPEETINCFLPGTRVSGLFVAGLKARYSGPMIELQTAQGARLSVTPNHPVLTDQGWIPAHCVIEGDCILLHRSHVENAAHLAVDN